MKLRRDRLIAVLENKINIYNLEDLKIIGTHDTFKNSRGLCAVSTVESSFVLVYPEQTRGGIRAVNYTTGNSRSIKACKSSVACIAVNPDGQLIATASDKGTLIQIFDSVEGTKLQQLRRGMDRAEIYSINFDPLSHWIVCTSDKGTVHIYALAASGFSNSRSPMSFMSKLLPRYFDSEWSFAQFRVADSKTVAAFTEDGSAIIVLSTEGKYYRAVFNPNTPGECNLQIVQSLIEIENS